jgi:hypothetical protein
MGETRFPGGKRVSSMPSMPSMPSLGAAGQRCLKIATVRAGTVKVPEARL